MRICKNCGSAFNDDDAFCPKCGEKRTEIKSDHSNILKEKVLETPETCLTRMRKTVKSREMLWTILAVAFVALGFVLALMTPGLKQTFKSDSLNSINPFIIPGILVGGGFFVIGLVDKNKMNKLLFAIQDQYLTITNMRVYGTSNQGEFNISLPDVIRVTSRPALHLVRKDFECALLLSIIHKGGEVRLECFDDAARIAKVIEKAKQYIS